MVLAFQLAFAPPKEKMGSDSGSFMVVSILFSLNHTKQLILFSIEGL